MTKSELLYHVRSLETELESERAELQETQVNLDIAIAERDQLRWAFRTLVESQGGGS